MTDEEEGTTRLTRSLSARFQRKAQAVRGEAVPDMPEEELLATANDQVEEPDEEAALSDEELLAKYGVDDPEVIEDEDKLDNLLQGQFPDRIRQMALRRMWRLNPLFRFADEMVEYGENYTDAATVIDGMQTAYQVGKGYLQKAFDAVDDEAAEGAALESEAEAGPEGADKSAEAADPSQSDQADAPQDQTPDTETPPGDEMAARADQQSTDSDAPTINAAPYDESTQAGVLNMADDAAETAPVPRPRRMTFRRSADQG